MKQEKWQKILKQIGILATELKQELKNCGDIRVDRDSMYDQGKMELDSLVERILKDVNYWLYNKTEEMEPPVSDYLYESKTTKDMKQTIKLNESQLRQVIRESIKNVLRETEGDAMAKAQEVVNKLKALNFEQRGHDVSIYDDEYPIQVGVTNVNVPAYADCKAIADELGCEMEFDRSWGVITFEIY